LIFYLFFLFSQHGRGCIEHKRVASVSNRMSFGGIGNSDVISDSSAEVKVIV